jgi:hypothetical protein
MRRILIEAAPRLFWDVDPTALDPERHEDFIIGRVLSEGDWVAMYGASPNEK